MSFNNNVRENLDKNIVTIVSDTCNNVNVTQPTTTIIEVLTGPRGNTGANSTVPGPSGSSAPFNYVTGSTWNTTSSIEITGSLTISGSNTFINIGPALFSGSVNITGSETLDGYLSITGSQDISGSINKIYLKRANNIYTVGDSLTAADIYQAQLTSSLGSNWSIVNFGIPGNTTSDIINRLSSITNGDANTVIVWAGINDIIQGFSSSIITSSLQSIYTQVKNTGARVIALTVSPFSGSVNWDSNKQSTWNIVNNFILNQAINLDGKINLTPILEFPSGSLQLSSSFNSGDYLHLNTSGYTVVGNNIYLSSSFILYTSSLENRIGKDLIINQNLSTLSNVVFKNLTLTQNFQTYGSGTFSGNVSSSGDIYGKIGTFSSNLIATGSIITLNGFLLGSSGGVSGSIGGGGGGLKIIPGTANPNLILSTPSASNGKFTIKNTTGNILIGDVASINDDISGSLQVYGSSTFQVINSKHSAPELSFWPSAATNSSINFRTSNTVGTIRGLIDLNISSGEMKFWGMGGGYFVTVGTNGSEAIRVNTSQNLGIGTAANINARVHISSSTEQLRIANTTSSYLSIIVSNTGNTSLFLTGSNSNPIFNFTGSISGSFTGSLLGTASVANQSITASYLNPLTQSVFVSGSLQITGSFSINNTGSGTTGTGSLVFSERPTLNTITHNGQATFNSFVQVGSTLFANLSGNWIIQNTAAAGNVLIQSRSSSGDFFNFMFHNKGFFGINQLSPSMSLDVSGSGRFTNSLYITGSTNITGSLVITGSTNLISIHNTSGSSLRICDWAGNTTTYGYGIVSNHDSFKLPTTVYFGDSSYYVNKFLVGGSMYGGAFNTFKDFKAGSNNNSRIFIYGEDSTGNVGIGTTSPSHSLDVSGSGRFRENLYVTGSTYTSGSTSITGSLLVYVTGSDKVNIGNKNTTSQRLVRIGQHTSYIDLGSLVNVEGFAAIYFDQGTPSTTNYILAGDSGNSFLNSTTNIGLRINNGDKLTISSTLTDIKQNTTISGSTLMTGSLVVTGSTNILGSVSMSSNLFIGDPTATYLKIANGASIITLSNLANDNMVINAKGSGGIFFGYNGHSGGVSIYDGSTSNTVKITQSSSICQIVSNNGNGNICLNNGSLLTGSSTGFPYIPTCAGAPNGTPTPINGMVPIIYDSVNNKLYIYNGGWKSGSFV